MEFIFKQDNLIEFSKWDKTKPEYLEDNISGDVFHNSFLHYLDLGYRTHYGVHVKPDFIWFTILNEISRVIKEDPDTYREIFTESKNKLEVSVFTGHPIIMPVERLLDHTFTLIPPSLNKSDICLNFSTSNAASRIAFSTAFLDAASPYYCYSMYLCGFNKLKVFGIVDDYKTVLSALFNLVVVFKEKPLQKYILRIIDVINRIVQNYNSESFWLDIFSVTNCGSGHQYKVYGWFKDLFADFDGIKFISAYPTHASVIQYKNLLTNSSYTMTVGVLSSKIEDDYLIPEFEFGINELKQS